MKKQFLLTTLIVVLMTNIGEAQTLFVPNGTSGIGSSTTSGRVGIGISNPAEALHINGSIRGNSTGSALRIQTPNGYIDIGAMGSNWAHFYTDQPRSIFNKPLYLMTGELSSFNTAPLIFQTNATTRMTIANATGHVGIGITNPQTRLHVSGGNFRLSPSTNKAITIDAWDITGE